VRVRRPSTLPYFDHLNRLAGLERALRANGQWHLPHPWLTTFVGDSAVEEVVGAELARMTPADLGEFGQVVLSAFRRRSVTSPLLRLPADELCYAFNLIRIPTTGSTAEADRLVAANRAAYERVRSAGGTLYPVSALPWHRRTAPAPSVQRSAAGRARAPSRTACSPGYEVFPDRSRIVSASSHSPRSSVMPADIKDRSAGWSTTTQRRSITRSRPHNHLPGAAAFAGW
jgi:hypothetical protein